MKQTTLDVLVIGAGQAGLAMGYQLRNTPLQYQLLDSHARIGESWRRRFDSLVLFSPRAYSALPGLALPGDPQGCPTKDEVADYLATYAQHFDLAVVPNTTISRLELSAHGFRAPCTAETVIEARAVVVATGAFQQPRIPALAAHLAPSLPQYSSTTYRNPAQIPAGRVLVVGDGATGRQIARELCSTHEVLLACGRPRRALPEYLLGRHSFWWMHRLGLLQATHTSWPGRWIQHSDPFPGHALQAAQLQRAGVRLTGRLVAAGGRQIHCTDLPAAMIDAVIWATGYRDQSDWLAVPGATDETGTLLHNAGVSPVPGLYHIGRPWQTTRSSALLYGVGDDAAAITTHLMHYLYRGAVGEVGRRFDRLASQL
ncbi:MAG TPA: NAD(P)/FAD-dependent oxidoreductase [Roseiflexaceae bacterium]|nr:NAD(P)/FAD-dependent oxidoreductase [Roseiflexaceae bacterium]